MRVSFNCTLANPRARAEVIALLRQSAALPNTLDDSRGLLARCLRDGRDIVVHCPPATVGSEEVVLVSVRGRLFSLFFVSKPKARGTRTSLPTRIKALGEVVETTADDAPNPIMNARPDNVRYPNCTAVGVPAQPERGRWCRWASQTGGLLANMAADDYRQVRGLLSQRLGQ